MSPNENFMKFFLKFWSSYFNKTNQSRKATQLPPVNWKSFSCSVICSKFNFSKLAITSIQYVSSPDDKIANKGKTGI